MFRSSKWFKIVSIALVCSALVVGVICGPSIIKRVPFDAPQAAYHSWDDILSHPQPISIRTYSTGNMRTTRSGIMNLEHPFAQDIQDAEIVIPVNVGIIQHETLGTYLIDAGLDKSYVHNQHGTIRGLMVEGFLGKGSQEPNTHIGAVLEQEGIQLKGVYLTHLHMDHTAGIVDSAQGHSLCGGERRALFQLSVHHAERSSCGYRCACTEIDFAKGIELPPLGKAVDLFGDGSLLGDLVQWAHRRARHLYD